MVWNQPLVPTTDVAPSVAPLDPWALVISFSDIPRLVVSTCLN